jgi:hypothetical protein
MSYFFFIFNILGATMRRYKCISGINLHWKVNFILLLTILVSLLIVSNTSAADVTLTWNKNSETHISGYKLYYGTSTRNYSKVLDAGNLTTYTITNLNQGTQYFIAATAYDAHGNESGYSSEISYTSPLENLPPVAQAGDDQVVYEDQTVTLDGSGSSDPDDGIAKYSWKQLSGASVTLATPNSPTTTFIAPKVGPSGGTLVFELTVVDGSGQASSDQCSITVNWVNVGPTADAGSDQVIIEKSMVYLDGSGSKDPDDGIATYQWTQSSGPAVNLANADKPLASFVAPAVTTSTQLAFTLKVTDKGGLSSTDNCIVTVQPTPLSDGSGSDDNGTGTDPLPDPPTSEGPRILAGEINIDHNWTQVFFEEHFVDPIVVSAGMSANDNEPATVRIRNVKSTGFEICVQEWPYQDGIHGMETVSYLVMERGIHTLQDGTLIEANSFTSDNARKFGSRSFSAQFSFIPVVMSSVTTYNKADTVSVRLRNITKRSLEFLVQEQERSSRARAPETVSYIAWEPSSGTVNGTLFLVGRTANQVTHEYTNITFNPAFGDIPAITVGMQTTNDADTANVRWRNKSRSGVEVMISEEQSKDAEMNHSAEVVGYIAFLESSEQSSPTTDELVVEDAEDGLTTRWIIFDNDPDGAQIRNIFDTVRQSRVIELQGSGLGNGYWLSNSGASWNSTKRIAVWSLQTLEPVEMFFELETTGGKRYLKYTPEDYDLLGGGEYVHIGLGSNANNGVWNTFTKDLEKDLQKAQPGVSILLVNSLSVRGNARFDDIKLR